MKKQYLEIPYIFSNVQLFLMLTNSTTYYCNIPSTFLFILVIVGTHNSLYNLGKGAWKLSLLFKLTAIENVKIHFIIILYHIIFIGTDNPPYNPDKSGGTDGQSDTVVDSEGMATMTSFNILVTMGMLLVAMML